MSQTAPQWSGDMLDQPEMVAVFSAQLRKMLAAHAEYVRLIRLDAEAMWDANPPAGYGTFESWWRSRWLKGPLAEIQEHLEKAAALTHRLEARHRKARHEIPAARQAARQKAPELGAGPARPGRFGSRERSSGPSRPAERAGEGEAGDFLDLVRRRRESA